MPGRYFIFISLFWSVALYSQPNGDLVYRGENGHVSFISEAPLEIISAESDKLDGIVDPVSNTFAFRLDVATLKGFNSPLQQEHFYENYIESEKFPVATFSGKIIEKIDFEKQGSTDIRAKGIFKIHGVAQERIIPCRIMIGETGLLATATFIVLLADHNISIPKVVYQKIAEEINVSVNIHLNRSPANFQ